MQYHDQYVDNMEYHKDRDNYDMIVEEYRTYLFRCSDKCYRDIREDLDADWIYLVICIWIMKPWSWDV